MGLHPGKAGHDENAKYQSRRQTGARRCAIGHDRRAHPQCTRRLRPQGAAKKLAADTGLVRSKVHRYLRSLRNAGLVSQEAETGLYQLGPQAIAIGLAALRGINPVAEVCNALPALRDEINQTVTAAVWSAAGPVLVAMQESDHWLTMNIRIGSRLPILTTAIGRTFLAHLPAADVMPVVTEERNAARTRGIVLPVGRRNRRPGG